MRIGMPAVVYQSYGSGIDNFISIQSTNQSLPAHYQALFFSALTRRCCPGSRLRSLWERMRS
jgi:hypothetical protein